MFNMLDQWYSNPASRVTATHAENHGSGVGGAPRIIHIDGPGCHYASLAFGLLHRMGQVREQNCQDADEKFNALLTRVQDLYYWGMTCGGEIGAFMRNNDARVDELRDAIVVDFATVLSGTRDDVNAHQHWINDRALSAQALIGIQFFSALSFARGRTLGESAFSLNSGGEHIAGNIGEYLAGQMNLDEQGDEHTIIGFRDLFQCPVWVFENVNGEIEPTDKMYELADADPVFDPVCIFWTGQHYDAVVH